MRRRSKFTKRLSPVLPTVNLSDSTTPEAALEVLVGSTPELTEAAAGPGSVAEVLAEPSVADNASFAHINDSADIAEFALPDVRPVAQIANTNPQAKFTAVTPLSPASGKVKNIHKVKQHHAKLVGAALLTSVLSFALAFTGSPAGASEPEPEDMPIGVEAGQIDGGELASSETGTEAGTDLENGYDNAVSEPQVPELDWALIEASETFGAPIIPPLQMPGGINARQPEAVWEPQPWNIDRGPNWTNRVLLTYDDCMTDPDRFIQVLDHATALHIGLLLFPTGNCVTMFQNRFGIDLPQAIRERGHWLGNHTITHPHLTRVSRGEITRQLRFPESNLVRPPFGDWNQTVYNVAAEMGMRLVMWDLDTNDWRGPRPEQEIIDFIVAYAEPGDNVLMHFQHQAFTTNALTEIQRGLRSRGIELCRPARPENRPTPVHVPDNIC